MGGLQTRGNRNSIGTTVQAFLTFGASPCIGEQGGVLSFSPDFQAVIEEIAFVSKNIGYGNPFWTWEAVSATAAKPLSGVPGFLHELPDLLV